MRFSTAHTCVEQLFQLPYTDARRLHPQQQPPRSLRECAERRYVSFSSLTC